MYKTFYCSVYMNVTAGGFSPRQSFQMFEPLLLMVSLVLLPWYTSPLSPPSKKVIL